MATFSRGQTFGVTETITNTKLHNLIDNATITNIVDADIAPGAAIQFSKLLASAIDGSLLTNLGNIPSGSGKIPFANLNVPFGSTYVSLVSIPNASLFPLTLASWVDGAAMKNIQSMPSLAGQLSWYNIVSSLASGAYPRYAGGNTFIASPPDSKSNIIFQWMGAVDAQGTSIGVLSATSLTSTGTGNYLYLATTSGSAQTVLATKWKKISGVNTVTVYARIWQNEGAGSGTRTATCTVTIGAASGSASGTAAQTTPEWVSFTIDVSALTNETVYDVSIKLNRNNDNVVPAYLGGIVGFGS